MVQKLRDLLSRHPAIRNNWSPSRHVHLALFHFRTPPLHCYWWLIMKKRGWKLYGSPNPNPRGYESAIALLIFGSRYNLPKLHAFLYSYVKYILHFLIRNVTTTVKFLKVFITWVNQLKKNVFISYNWIPCKQYYYQDSSWVVFLPLLYNPTYPTPHNNTRTFICFLND